MSAAAPVDIGSGAEPGPADGRPRGYTRLQVAMHWAVVALVIEQYATSGAIVRTHGMRMIGQRQDPADLILHNLHNKLGLLLTALMIGRLALRVWAGAPRPAGIPGWHRSAIAAGLLHHAFYAVLVAEGVAGAVASYLWWPASALHVLLVKALLALVAAHLAASLWHQLVLRDAVLQRMGIWPRTTPSPSSTPHRSAARGTGTQAGPP